MLTISPVPIPPDYDAYVSGKRLFKPDFFVHSHGELQKGVDCTAIQFTEGDQVLGHLAVSVTDRGLLLYLATNAWGDIQQAESGFQILTEYFSTRFKSGDNIPEHSLMVLYLDSTPTELESLSLFVKKVMDMGFFKSGSAGCYMDGAKKPTYYFFKRQANWQKKKTFWQWAQSLFN